MAEIQTQPSSVERRWVRSVKSGDLAEVIVKDGKPFVVYPGRQGQADIPFRDGDWVDEEKPRKVTEMQCAEIAWAADQKLQYFMGERVRAKKEWLALTDDERIAYTKKGPKMPVIRRILWKLIMRATEPLR